MSAFLFDLDMTLLDTSALYAWRSMRMWPRVMSNLHRVTAFPEAAHELPAQLKAQGHDVAVVTASPSKYAKALLAEFDIPYDALVAYHDTERHKPDPEPIEAALEELGVAPEDAYHIGDSPIDTEASFHAGVMSIGAGWGVRDWEPFSASAPDILLFDPNRLLNEAKFPQYGYLGEVFPDEKPIWHQGSVLPLGSIAGYALGRYFVVADPRHGESHFAQSIITFKDSDVPGSNFAKMLGVAVKRLKIVETHPYYVCVPPKPKQRHRFNEMMKVLRQKLPDEADVDPEGMKCVRDPGNLKGMGRAERQKAVKNAFRSNYTWGDSGVVLLDDVLTTNATVSECKRVLQRNKASEVLPFLIGRDQHIFENKLCPECDSKMVVRTNRSTKERFWGCSAWPDCKHSESMPK